MAAFAGFKDLADYITRRCKQRQISFRELSLATGNTHSYVRAIVNGDFGPSPERLDKISAHFEDPPRIARILAGFELPPAEEDKIISEIKEIAGGLSDKNRK